MAYHPAQDWGLRSVHSSWDEMEEPTAERGDTKEKIALDCDGDCGGRGQYWLTRVVFLQCLGCVYLVAFLVALNDNAALVNLQIWTVQ